MICFAMPNVALFRECACMNQLLITFESWTELLDDGDPADVIYSPGLRTSSQADVNVQW